VFNGESYFHRAVETRPRPGSSAVHQLHVLFPERILRENLRQAIVPPLAVGGIALALAILASLTLANRLSRPIMQLRSQVSRIAEGEFQPLPLPTRDDELLDLVESVNRMAQKLAQLTQTLQRTERLALLGQLGAGLAHHLRNDITGAKMAVQLHQRGCRAADPQSLNVALRQLVLTEEHLQQFLTIGRPRPPHQVDCDLRQILSELLVMVEPTSRHRRIDMKEIGKNGPLPLRADPGQIRQMLLNLVLNAVDAAGTAGWVHVEAKADRPAGQLHVLVSDSGPGPPAEIREKLFEPFVTGKPEGIGLGLAAARQIAETHGGRLALLPTSPTCFEVVLPGTFSEEPPREPT
jgi:signal transduction histidine kinase